MTSNAQKQGVIFFRRIGHFSGFFSRLCIFFRFRICTSAHFPDVWTIMSRNDTWRHTMTHF